MILNENGNRHISDFPLDVTPEINSESIKRLWLNGNESSGRK